MSDETNALVGHNVKTIRQTIGMRQEDLADVLKISQPHLSMLERGTRSWSMEMAAAAADALKVDIRLLMPASKPRRTA